MGSNFPFTSVKPGKKTYLFNETITIVASTVTTQVFDLPPGRYHIGGVFQSIGNTGNSVKLEFFFYGNTVQDTADANPVHVILPAGGTSVASLTHAINTPTTNVFTLCGVNMSGFPIPVQPLIVPFGIKVVTTTGAGTAAGSYKVKIVAVSC